MTPQQWAFLTSFIAMLLIAGSYFVKKKDSFLILQSFGVTWLLVSYLCSGQYFALVGLGIGLCRMLAYYVYEKRNETAPVWVASCFIVLTLIAYFTINFGIEKTARFIDIVYLVSLIGYILVFRMRSLVRMRYFAFIPIVCAALYNAFSGAAIFAVITYVFEFCANALAIIKHFIFDKKENTHEKG